MDLELGSILDGHRVPGHRNDIRLLEWLQFYRPKHIEILVVEALYESL